MDERQSNSSVYIVLRDLMVSEQIAERLKQFGYDTYVFNSGLSLLEYLIQPVSPKSRCLITEFELQQMDGLSLQRRLKEKKFFLPIVFYVECPRVPDAFGAAQAGAIDVIERSPDHHRLLNGVADAIRHYQENLSLETRRFDTLTQLKTLNEGEHQVLDGILRGMMNKEIARSLNLSIRTIEQRRRQVFRKLGVQHPAELAQLVIDATHAPIDYTIKDHNQPLRAHFPSSFSPCIAEPVLY